MTADTAGDGTERDAAGDGTERDAAGDGSHLAPGSGNGPTACGGVTERHRGRDERGGPGGGGWCFRSAPCARRTGTGAPRSSTWAGVCVCARAPRACILACVRAVCECARACVCVSEERVRASGCVGWPSIVISGMCAVSPPVCAASMYLRLHEVISQCAANVAPPV